MAARRRARRRARRGRGRGAAGDPRRRRGAVGDDAHARPRRGAGARLPVRRGADPEPRRARPARPTTSRPTSSRSPGRCCATRRRASFYTTSSCGVCGKGALEEVAVHAPRAAGGAADRRARCWPSCPERLPPADVRPHAAGCTRPGCSPPTGELRVRARGRRPPQRDGQGDRPRAARRAAAAPRAGAVRQRAAVVRARAEGRGRGRAGARRRRRADVARDRARRRPRDDARRLRARREA